MGEIRHKGLLFGIELVEDKKSKRPASPQSVEAAISGCKERGLIVNKNGDTVAGYDNVLVMSPPLSISDEDVRFIAETLKASMQDL